MRNILTCSSCRTCPSDASSTTPPPHPSGPTPTPTLTPPRRRLFSFPKAVAEALDRMGVWAASDLLTPAELCTSSSERVSMSVMSSTVGARFGAHCFHYGPPNSIPLIVSIWIDEALKTRIKGVRARCPSATATPPTPPPAPPPPPSPPCTPQRPRSPITTPTSPYPVLRSRLAPSSSSSTTSRTRSAARGTPKSCSATSR